MAFDTKAIANEFLEIVKSKKETITPLKLQKLIYYAHGWNLALFDRTLIHEQIEASQYGPIATSINHYFQGFGNNPINDLITDASEYYNYYGYSVLLPAESSEDKKNAKAVVNRIYEIYGKFSTVQLCNLSHAVDTPWHLIYKQYNENIPLGTDIPTDVIKDHFKKILTKNDNPQ